MTPRTAIVTGSTSGIGCEIARALAEHGWHVVLNGINEVARGQELAASLPSAQYVDADVSNASAVRDLVDRVMMSTGRLDLVVNNAGIARPIAHDDLDAVEDEFWDRIMAVNLRGPWNLARAAREELARSGGQIVNVASIAGLSVAGSSIPYAVSKAGVIHLTRLLAKALGPEIRVNAVAPGYIDTPLTHDWSELREHVVRVAPARRLGEPSDVARVVLGLLEMTYVTGTVIPVAGGLELV